MKRQHILLFISVTSLLTRIKCDETDIDPCADYATLDADNRVHTIRQNNNVCDSGLTEAWYKLEIGGIAAEIPRVCLKNNVCGTGLPLRLDLGGEQLPVAGVVLHAHVCTSYNVLAQWDCCVLRQKISIKNCGQFYVYHLKPTDRCPVAYCAQEIGDNPSDELTVKSGDFLDPASIAHSTSPPTSIPISTTYRNMSTTTTAATADDISGSLPAAVEHNITLNTTSEPTISNATSENVTSEDGILPRSGNLTMSFETTTEAYTVNMTTVAPATGNVTTDVEGLFSTQEPFEITTDGMNTTQNTTLECTAWPTELCADRKTICYISASKIYIVCADGNGCGVYCDNLPDCQDGSDENSDICPSGRLCVESQMRCVDNSGCYTRCDGHITCVNATNGEDEEGCPVRPTSASHTTDKQVDNNNTDSVEFTTSSTNDSAGSLATNEHETTTRQDVETTIGHNTETTTEQDMGTTIEQDTGTSIGQYTGTTIEQVTVTSIGQDTETTIGEDTGTTAQQATVTTVEQTIGTTIEPDTESTVVEETITTVGHVIESSTGIDTETTVGQNAGTTVEQATTTIAQLITGTTVGQYTGITIGQNTGTTLDQDAGTTLDQDAGTTVEQVTGTTIGLDTRTTNRQSIQTTIGQDMEATTIKTIAETTIEQDTETAFGQETETTIGQDTQTTLGQDTETTVGQVTETTAGTVTQTSIGQVTQTSIGHSTETTIGQDTEPTDGQVTETTGGQVTETTTGQNTETTIGQVTETTVGQVTETSIGQVAETSVGQVIQTSTGQATETTIGQDTETTVGQDTETTVGQGTESTVGQVTETTIGQDTETTIGHVTETTIGQDTGITVRQSIETTIGQDIETTIGQVTETNIGQNTETTVGQVTEITPGPIEISTSSSPPTQSQPVSIGSVSVTNATTRTVPLQSSTRTTVQSSTDSQVDETTAPTIIDGTVDTSTARAAKITSHTKMLSSEFSSVTGPQPTSSAENQTDHKIWTTDEKVGLFYKNIGLSIFLIVCSLVISGICIFGIIGYKYQRRSRTWNPNMIHQDAYGDMEKTVLSFGQEKSGIDNPIPDFDILHDETMKVEETSLSQASTLLLGTTLGQMQPPYDDNYDMVPTSQQINGDPAILPITELTYTTNGLTNEGFVADDNVDGIVPVDQLDKSPPRTLFPWIESAADTKL